MLTSITPKNQEPTKPFTMKAAILALAGTAAAIVPRDDSWSTYAGWSSESSSTSTMTSSTESWSTYPGWSSTESSSTKTSSASSTESWKSESTWKAESETSKKPKHTPTYFMEGCCKTVVTTTVYGSST